VQLSVIVPVYNGQDVLARCLDGLTKSSLAPHEIIVVDDGSTDASAAVAGRFPVRVLRSEGGPRGPGHARNRGVEAASGEVVVFIDADVVVHPDTLVRMRDVFERDPDVHALFGSYDDAPPALGVASRFKNLLHHYVHQHGQREASTFWAGCGAVRKPAFVAVGGFDEAYRTASIEDIELGLRLRQAGLRIRLCPDIQAAHLKRWTLGGLWRTDVFCRAVPWTRLILRVGNVPADLNLSWRSRASAAAAWLAALLLLAGLVCLGVGRTGCAGWSASGVVLALGTSTWLNADLHGFFLRKGGVGFALGAWALHHAYLLYSSATFGILSALQMLHLGKPVRHGQASR
jgi:GT2 family glycosyltransferase